MAGHKYIKFNKKISLKDEVVFNFIFTEYYKTFVLFASNFLNNDKVVSEDIVQDVFTKMLQSNYSFEGINDLKSFLYISIRNSCIDYNKHAKVERMYISEKRNILSKEIFFQNHVLEEEIYAHLVKSIEKLPTRCRMVFELSLLGIKNSEIASQLKISIETVKSQKRRGKQILKKMVKPLLFLF